MYAMLDGADALATARRTIACDPQGKMTGATQGTIRRTSGLGYERSFVGPPTTVCDQPEAAI